MKAVKLISSVPCSSACCRYSDHLRERPPGIGEVLQKSCGSVHVERGIRKWKRPHLPDLKGDGDLAFAGASPGFSDHGLARVEPDKTARGADDLHQVEEMRRQATSPLPERSQIAAGRSGLVRRQMAA
jgi:hypothetical protein